jgi:hypothetical protein
MCPVRRSPSHRSGCRPPRARDRHQRASPEDGAAHRISNWLMTCNDPCQVYALSAPGMVTGVSFHSSGRLRSACRRLAFAWISAGTIISSPRRPQEAPLTRMLETVRPNTAYCSSRETIQLLESKRQRNQAPARRSRRSSARAARTDEPWAVLGKRNPFRIRIAARCRALHCRGTALVLRSQGRF